MLETNVDRIVGLGVHLSSVRWCYELDPLRVPVRWYLAQPLDTRVLVLAISRIPPGLGLLVSIGRLGHGSPAPVRVRVPGSHGPPLGASAHVDRATSSEIERRSAAKRCRREVKVDSLAVGPAQEPLVEGASLQPGSSSRVSCRQEL